MTFSVCSLTRSVFPSPPRNFANVVVTIAFAHHMRFGDSRHLGSLSIPSGIVRRQSHSRGQQVRKPTSFEYRVNRCESTIRSNSQREFAFSVARFSCSAAIFRPRASGRGVAGILS